MHLTPFKADEEEGNQKVVVLQEVRWHGRGGQGVWTASELLAKAAIHEGKYIQSFPEFGPERMGAPVRAYTRISDKPINLHCAIYTPDVAVVLDPTLFKTVPVAEGLPEDGILIVNIRESPVEIRGQPNLAGHKCGRSLQQTNMHSKAYIMKPKL